MKNILTDSDFFLPRKFQPAKFGPLAVWLDAADLSTITKDGSNLVSAWADKSGNANNAAQATDANKPIYTAGAVNSRPALKFYNSATASNLTITDHASLNYTNMSIFAVVQRHADLGTTERIVAKLTTTGDQQEFSLHVSGGDAAQFASSAVGDATLITSTAAGTLSAGTGYILDTYYNGTNQVLALNNAAPDTDAQTAIFNGTSPLFIGSRNALGTPFAGYVGEVLFYTDDLSTAQRLAVLQYLSHKWGIAI